MRLAPLTIAAGVSRTVTNEELAKFASIVIYSPTGNAVANVEVTHKRSDETIAAADWVPLHSSGAAVVLPVGPVGFPITAKGFESLRLTGTNTNVFQITGQEAAELGH